MKEQTWPLTEPLYRNSRLSHSEIMQYSDFPRDSIMTEYVSLWNELTTPWLELDLNELIPENTRSSENRTKETPSNNESENKKPTSINKELQTKIFWYFENIQTMWNYQKWELQKIDTLDCNSWDIIIINFIKYTPKNSINITLRFLVHIIDNVSINWYLMINDEETWIHSKIMDENMTFPIIKWWDKDIKLTTWIHNDALIEILSTHLYEWKIRNIILYKKIYNQQWIKPSQSLWSLIKRKIWNLIWKK